MAMDLSLRNDDDKHRFWNTAPVDPVKAARMDGRPHFNRVLGRVLMPDSFMPVGHHREKTMRNMPASYLLWVWENPKLKASEKWAPVIDYIERHLPQIRAQGDGLVWANLTAEDQAKYV